MEDVGAPESETRGSYPDKLDEHDTSGEEHVRADPNDEAAAAFFRAAQEGNLEKLKAAISPSLNLNALHEFDKDRAQTALYAAVEANHRHIVDFLIGLGVDLEVRCSDNGTRMPALCQAAYQANPEMVRVLLEAGADARTEFDFGHYDDGPVTCLVLRRLWPRDRHVEQRHVDCLDLLLGLGGADPNAPCGEGGMDLLESAVAAGSLDLVRSLIARGARLHTERRRHRYTRVHTEHRRDRYPGVHTVRQRGDDLILAAARDNGTTEVLDYLIGELGLSGSWLSAMRMLAYDPIPHQVHVPMARLLFGRMRPYTTRRFGFPQITTLRENLRAAAFNNNLPLLLFLLEEGVGVNEVNGYEKSLLEASRNKGGVALIALLLALGTRKTFRTPPSGSCFRCGYDCRESFTGWNNAREKFTGWNNALHITAARYYDVSESVAVVKLLLDSGVDADARNLKGETPLLTHARKSWGSWWSKLDRWELDYLDARLGCLALLADACQDVNAVDNWGRSALHLLASSPSSNVSAVARAVEILVRKGADPNIRDYMGMTGAYCLWAGLGITIDPAQLTGGLIIEDQWDDRPDSEGYCKAPYQRKPRRRFC